MPCLSSGVLPVRYIARALRKEALILSASRRLSLSGILRPAASMAYASAASLPAMRLWLGPTLQRRAQRPRLPCPAQVLVPVWIRSIAACESVRIVKFLPLSREVRWC